MPPDINRFVRPGGATDAALMVSLPAKPASRNVLRSATPVRLLTVKVSAPPMPSAFTLSTVPMSRVNGSGEMRSKSMRPPGPNPMLKTSFSVSEPFTWTRSLPVPAVHHVGAIAVAPNDLVVVSAAVERVALRAAYQDVVPGAAGQRVGAEASYKAVRSGTARHVLDIVMPLVPVAVPELRFTSALENTCPRIDTIGKRGSYGGLR